MFALAVLLYAPVAAAVWRVDAAAIPYIGASAALELAYLALLAAAYRRAELSLVYPIARGIAPVLVLVAGVLVLAEETSASEAAGVGLVAAGVLLVRGLRMRADGVGVGLALATGCCIAAYTLVDSRGVEHANPIAYLELVMAGPAALYLAGVLLAKGVEPVRRELRVSAVFAALATFGAFAFALAALRIASPASVAAVRETSVVIAVALAAPVLRERVGRGRLAGAVVVAAGVAMLALD